MKQLALILLLLLGFSFTSLAQSAGRGEKEKSGKSSSSRRKPRKQMSHFDTQGKDPNIKNNGTSYRRRNKKKVYNVDGDGFNVPAQH